MWRQRVQHHQYQGQSQVRTIQHIADHVNVARHCTAHAAGQAHDGALAVADGCRGGPRASAWVSKGVDRLPENCVRHEDGSHSKLRHSSPRASGPRHPNQQPPQHVCT